MRKITLSLRLFALIMAAMLLTAGSALALPYIEAGTPANNTAGTGMVFGYYMSGSFGTTYNSGATKAIRFTGNQIWGPAGDAIADPWSYSQAISGIYTLAGSGSIYSLSLTSGTASNLAIGGTLLTAQTKALEINLTSNTISWSPVQNVTVNDSIGSQALTDLAAASTYSFTSFTFEQLGTESTWLSNSGGYNARYYSRLTGVAAAPEPAEWMLIIIGLALTGFYLHRRGALNLGPAPGAAA